MADICIDVGANVGLYTCLARARGKPTIAIEPLPSNLNFLYRNLMLNEFRDVEVFPLGIGAKPEIKNIRGFSDIASFVQDWSRSARIRSEPVPVSTLDILIGARFAGQRLFIKMDIEGYEFEALHGALHTLQRMPRPIWMVEIMLENPMAKTVNSNFHRTFDLFWRSGYKSSVALPGLAAVTEDSIDRWTTGKTRQPAYNFVFYDSCLPLHPLR
jgi:FkbM family methyltransferase